MGWSCSLKSLKREFCEQGRGFSEMALGRALGVLQRREVVQMRQGGGQVYRCGVKSVGGMAFDEDGGGNEIGVV